MGRDVVLVIGRVIEGVLPPARSVSARACAGWARFVYCERARGVALRCMANNPRKLNEMERSKEQDHNMCGNGNICGFVNLRGMRDDEKLFTNLFRD